MTLPCAGTAVENPAFCMRSVMPRLVLPAMHSTHVMKLLSVAAAIKNLSLKLTGGLRRMSALSRRAGALYIA